MNSNINNYGNHGTQQPAAPASMGFQDPAAFYQMPNSSGNQTQDFNNMIAVNHQMDPEAWTPMPNFYPAQHNFGATLPPPSTQFAGNDGTGSMMAPLPKTHRKPKIVGGMDWEAEIRINRTCLDSAGYWNENGFHLHNQTPQSQQQLPQHTVQVPVTLPATQVAPDASFNIPSTFNWIPVYDQAQRQSHQARLPQQVQQRRACHGRQVALPFAMPVPHYPFQSYQAPLPASQTAPQAPSNAPSTSNQTMGPFFNPSLPPYTNSSAMMQHPRITVNLCNLNIWRMFFEMEHEMSVDNHGKELFPQLKYGVTGLIQGNRYKFVLVLERVGSYGYTWNSKQKKFEVDSNADAGSSVSNKILTGIRTGQEWENDGIDFGEVNLYNVGDPNKSNKATKEGPMTKYQIKKAQQKAKKVLLPRICVTLGCKYIPVLTILEVVTDVCVPRGEYRFDESSFIAVSHYRNTEVRDQKSALNKSVGKTTKTKAQKKLEERNETRPDSGYSTFSDPTPPPAAYQYFAADGSFPSTSSSC